VRIQLLACALLLAGCDEPQVFHTDQNLHTDRFEACMRLLPEGPASTKYNDWDEVVRACDAAAYSQAQRCVKNCRFDPTPAAEQEN
jgi:hypothetical protein